MPRTRKPTVRWMKDHGCLHIEAPFGIVNVNVGLHDRFGRGVTAAEHAVLRSFARSNGHFWKAALGDTWSRACADISWDTPSCPDYRCTLQRLRNDPDWGSRGLAAYRLPKD